MRDPGNEVVLIPAKSPDSWKNFVFLPKQTLSELSPSPTPRSRMSSLIHEMPVTAMSDDSRIHLQKHTPMTINNTKLSFAKQC